LETCREPWAVVLAAGEGSRLRSLTTDAHGNSTPKQFCSLDGGPSLLRLALRRAERVARRSRVTTIVAAQHAIWWRGEIGLVPDSNVVVQPCNRGTAVGVLLPLLRILARDPGAHVVLLPSDHFVAEESVLERALRDAIREVSRRPARAVLLGVVPYEPDPGFGWIVPADHGRKGARQVLRFVEKPPAATAAELMSRGGVWNSFIMAGAGSTFLEMFEDRLPGVITRLREALAPDAGAASTTGALARAYRRIGSFDFCRDVLEGSEDRLSVLPVPPCGWSDLGTPDRVARCVERIPRTSWSSPRAGGRSSLAQAAVAMRPCSTP